MLETLLGKYRGIVFSIAFFLLLDASVLMLNFYISYQISDDAIAVNVSGRQRMLSQKLVKTVYEIQRNQENPSALDRGMKALSQTAQMFETTLLAFENGGLIKGTDGTPVTIQAENSLVAKSVLIQANQLWRPLKQSIDQLLLTWETQQPLENQISETVQQAERSNMQLLFLMNKLTTELENTATNKATTLRIIQSIGIGLATVNFLIILFHFLSQLKTNDRKLEAAKQETTDILNTVNEGLFLIDKNLLISSQHSAKLTSIFGGKPVSNISFSTLIEGLVCDKDLHTAKRFVNLLFRKDIQGDLIKDLNPLSEIEINIPNISAGFTTRYLSFDFSRVLENDSITGVLVTVNDITDRVILARKLDQSRSENEQQIAMLTSIIHTDPNILKRFIEDAFDTFQRINKLLKDQQKTPAALERKLHELYIEVHNFKGSSSAYQLDHYTQLASQFEQAIEELKIKPELTGNDFLRLTVMLENCYRHTESIQTLTKKLAEYAQPSPTVSANPIHRDLDNWTFLNEMTTNIVRRTKKQAQLVMTGFIETVMDSEQQSLIRDLCIQFIRNSVVHGLEAPSVRKSLRKPETGRIDARLCQLNNGHLELSIVDDGRGLDYELIRQKALASGRWSANDISKWSNKKLITLIFEPGFSTQDICTEDAGRGIGMDVIVNRIKRMKGHIRVTSRTGSYCHFTVTLPQGQKQIPSSHAA